MEGGASGQEGATSPLQGAFKLCEENDVWDSVSFGPRGEHDREGRCERKHRRRNGDWWPCPVSRLLWGIKIEMALHTRNLIQLAAAVCLARCTVHEPSIHLWKWQLRGPLIPPWHLEAFLAYSPHYFPRCGREQDGDPIFFEWQLKKLSYHLKNNCNVNGVPLFTVQIYPKHSCGIQLYLAWKKCGFKQLI